MRAYWFVELSVQWAVSAHAWRKQRLPFLSKPVQSYWGWSRQRADQWHEALHHYRQQLGASGASQRMQAWFQIRRVIQEILLSEPMSRIIAASTAVLEQAGIDSDSSPVAINVLRTHLEARQRALQIMVDLVGQPVSDAVYLNQLRYQLEEWTDLLLKFVGLPGSVADFAHRPYEMQSDGDFGSIPIGREFLLASILGIGFRQWLENFPFVPDANPRLNEAVARSIVGLWRPEWFDSFGYGRRICHLHWLDSIHEGVGFYHHPMHIEEDQNLGAAGADRESHRYRPSSPNDLPGNG